MSRDLTVNQIANLTQQQYISENLIEIYTGEGTDYFYTTGLTDVDVDTGTTSGSETFLVNNQISVVSEFQEDYDPQVGTFTLQWETLDNNLVDILTTDFLKTRIVVYKMFRDSTTLQADTANLIQIIDSTVTELDITADEQTQAVNLRCQTVFANLNAVKGRTNGNFAPDTTATIFWGQIVYGTN